MMNPKMLMQMKSLLTKFRQNHPKVPMFFSAASRAINEGSVTLIIMYFVSKMGSVPCDQRGQCDRDQFDYGRGKRTLHQYACDPGRSGNGADSGGDGIEVR